MTTYIHFTSLKNSRRVKKKIWPKVIVYCVFLMFISINSAGFYIGNTFYKKAFQIDTKKNIDQYDLYKTTFNEKRYASLQKEEVSITSTRSNYKLYGTLIKNAKSTKDTIILVHGLGGSRWSILKFSDMYLDKGFNVLIYDERDHGHSGGDNVTYGFDEKYDLDRWVNWVYTRYKGGIIGVHGESLGAASALLQAKLNEDKKRVSFYISDCAYSDLKALFAQRLSEDYKFNNKAVSSFILFYAEKIAKLKDGFTFADASPDNIIKEISAPVMFIHGENDNFVPKKMSEELYAQKNGTKSLYIAPNSGHAQAFMYNQDDYKDKVYNFIDSCIQKK